MATNAIDPVVPQSARPITRIHLIDNLRGVALVGILLLHCVQHFSLYVYPESGPAWLITADRITLHAAFLLFFGKAHAVFALLFGVSYHIQERNNLRKGIHHKRRMLRRMGWLFLFGILHGLFFPGDILCILALFGMLLILIADLSSRALFTLAVLLALQPILLVKGLLNDSAPLFASEAGYVQGMIRSLQYDDLPQLLASNLWSHRITETWLTISSGRIFQLGSWILIGVIAARKGYFQDPIKHQRSNWIAFSIAIPFYVLLVVADPVDQVWINMAERWKETALVVIYISAAMLVAARWQIANAPTLLASYGRMSLTNYISQGILGSVLFYGYGLALYQLGATLSLLIAFGILAVQMVFTWWWSSHNTRGPLEYLWAKLAAYPVAGERISRSKKLERTVS